MIGAFQDRIALVTGAASGLGKATAEAFARAGAAVFAIDRDPEGLSRLSSSAASAGLTISTFVADISEPAICNEAVARAVETFGGLHVLANVAGVAMMARITDTTPEMWFRTISVNLGGVFFLCRAAIPHLLRTGGSIVNVASSAGYQGQAYMSPYCASKAGVIALTKSLAMEYMKHVIRINAVAPAGMNTPMAQTMVHVDNPDLELAARYRGMRRFSEPEEVAELILYLASDKAASIHGACLSIDQGQTAG